MLEVIGTAEIPFTHDPFSSEQRGFRADGLPCVGFSSSGNDLCPFRYVVEWKANCTGPCRSPKSIAIRANLEYSPTPQKRVAYNTKMRSLKVSHPIPYNRVERISIGGFDYGVCAMFTDGTAKCWGSNSSGLLGTNEPHGTQHARPQFIKGFDGVRALRDIVAINTNANGTRCALLKSKRVVCWGENQTGQVGIGKLGPPEGGVGQSYYTHPVDYVRAPTGGILENVDQIYDGGEHTVCASSGMNVYCWGTYSLEASSCSMRRDLLGATYYQINHEPLFPSGYQSSQTFTSVPNKLMDVAPGDEHSIIDNLESHGMRIEPAGCTIPPDWTRFNKGPAASCFLVGDPARAVCWGRNQNSSLGIGGYLGGGPGSEDLLGPTKEHYIPAVGYQHQRLRPSAKAAISEPAVPPLLGIIDIELGSREAMCALLKTGEGVCWGDQQSHYFGAGGYHLLGNGDTSNSTFNPPSYIIDSTGVPGSRLRDIKKIKAGTYHICALKHNGEVYCWGGNRWGALGPNIPINQHSAVPIHVPLPRKAVQIQAGAGHSCALLEFGEVYCWGLNHKNQLGVDMNLNPYSDSASSTPRQVGDLEALQ
jgi:alpha-tubulin suppressor-like RCC1 family protein